MHADTPEVQTNAEQESMEEFIKELEGAIEDTGGDTDGDDGDDNEALDKDDEDIFDDGAQS